MRGGCQSFGLLNILFASLLLACGDNRGTRVTPGGSDQLGGSAEGAMPDTVADTSTSSAARVDSPPARATPPKKPSPPSKPAAAAPKPPAPAPSDSPPAAQPAQPADTAAAQAPSVEPLRDAYHQAPRDTVTQVAYDGWKQFNLLCARCHGEDALGTTIAPHLVESLKPTGPINTKELFVQTVCAGRPEKGMPAWCPLGLEMDKIEAIYIYVKGRSEGTIHPGRPAVKPAG